MHEVPLSDGAVAGTAIDPNTGSFTFLPAPDQPPSTNRFTITVTDDGQPQMSDQKTFVVIVEARAAMAPAITSAKLFNGRFSFEFLANADRTYTIESSADLIAWTVVTTISTDAKGKANFSEAILPKMSNRYYTVRSK